MSRIPTITAAFLCALLAFFPLQAAPAATKKSSTKKTSAAARKKKAASTTKKKSPSVEVGHPDPEGTGGQTGKPPLDLPLPEKLSSLATVGSSTEKAAENVPSDKLAGRDLVVKREPSANATIEPDALTEFSAQSPRVQQLLRDAIDLTRLNLTYTSGSDHPDNGGMDGAGSIFYLLRAHGCHDVTRDPGGQYLWARKSGAFYPVLGKDAESVEFNELLPGDLMFWAGGDATESAIPVSQVMLYLGREKATGQRIMFGASEGLTYQGVLRRGVSVFDFEMPKRDPSHVEKPKTHFVGYVRIPGFRSALTPAEPAPTVERGIDPPKKTKAASLPKKKGAKRKSK